MFGKLLAVKPLLWICGLLLAAVGALTLTMIVKDARHNAALTKAESARDDATRNLSAANDEVDRLAKTNTNQQGVVEALAGKLDAAISETERLDGLLTIAQDRLIAATRARDDALAKLTTERENDYATDPNCAAWGAAAVCGRLTDGLLDQWRDAQATARR